METSVRLKALKLEHYVLFEFNKFESHLKSLVGNEKYKECEVSLLQTYIDELKMEAISSYATIGKSMNFINEFNANVGIFIASLHDMANPMEYETSISARYDSLSHLLVNLREHDGTCEILFKKLVIYLNFDLNSVYHPF